MIEDDHLFFFGYNLIRIFLFRKTTLMEVSFNISINWYV